jgi:cytochrome c
MTTEISAWPEGLGRGGLTPRHWVAIVSSAIIFAIVAYIFLSPDVTAAAAVQSGDAGRGKEIFEKRCTGCHSLDGEKEGPRLRTVYGRKAGSIGTFKYSDAVQKSNVIWDSITLDKWLTDPDKFIPDNDMAFRLAKPDERSDVIAYLKQLSGK